MLYSGLLDFILGWGLGCFFVFLDLGEQVIIFSVAKP